MAKSGGLARVGAVIVNWNSFEHLRRCLAALAAQEVSFASVVVIDNHSIDAPAELQFVPCPENLHYLRLPYNAGFAGGNNLALQQLADCEWVALVNPDAFLDPGWLRHMIDAAARHPGYSCFASRLVSARQPLILDGLGDVYHASGLVWRHGHGRPQQEVSEAEVFSPCAASAMYRREALSAVGGFDEDFFCYLEDVDLGFRLRLAGHRCMLVPDAVAHHIGSATTGGQHSDFAIYHGHRNLVWTFIKNMPGALFWLFLPWHLVMNLASIVWFSLGGHGRVILRAKLDALKGIPKMWRKRREIQARRRASLGDIWRVIDKRIVPGPGGMPQAGK
ncbi:MAG: glycosyltransferase family 2 protein [Pseudomonadota bacterium]